MSLQVLVIDDDPLALRLAKAILEKDGHRTTVVSSWSQIGFIAPETPFDLAVIDVNIPGGSGEELVRAMKDTRGGAALLVVLVSNLPEDDLALRALTSGADAWFRKPLTREGVRDLIRRLFSQVAETA